MIVPETHCPKCGYKMDSASPAFEKEETMPTKGDITMCLNCGEMLVFTKSLELRLPNKQELNHIRSDPRIMQMQILRAGIVPDERLKR